MAEKLSLREFIVRAAVMFVVIAGGVAVGLGIGTKMGFGSGKGNFDPSENLSIQLRTGKSIPHIQVRDSAGAVVDLASVVNAERQVVAFVSPTCGPCQNLMMFIAAAAPVKSGDLPVVVVTTNAAAFAHFEGATFYNVASADLDSIDVKLFPTFIGTEHGRIVFAQASFDPNKAPAFLTTGKF
jgi:hypothetical protein